MTTDHAMKPRARRYKINHIITVDEIYIYIYIVLHMAVMQMLGLRELYMAR